MTKFKQFERYPTRNGGTALVLATDEHGATVAFYGRDGGFRMADRTHPDGRYVQLMMHEWDILPPEPEKRTMWVNVWRGKCGLYFGSTHDSRAEADADIAPGRAGCHRIEIRAEFEEDAP